MADRYKDISFIIRVTIWLRIGAYIHTFAMKVYCHKSSSVKTRRRDIQMREIRTKRRSYVIFAADRPGGMTDNSNADSLTLFTEKGKWPVEKDQIDIFNHRNQSWLC